MAPEVCSCRHRLQKYEEEEEEEEEGEIKGREKHASIMYDSASWLHLPDDTHMH